MPVGYIYESRFSVVTTDEPISMISAFPNKE